MGFEQNSPNNAQVTLLDPDNAQVTVLDPDNAHR